jgi:sialate O-acetylesterase
VWRAAFAPHCGLPLLDIYPDDSRRSRVAQFILTFTETKVIMSKRHLSLALFLSLTFASRAELKLPAIIGNHMVLQQKQANPIWGWDTPGTTVTVTFAGQTNTAVAGDDGKWTVKLAPLPANVTPQTLVITGTSRKEIRDVLIGEVWVCSGQSNMGFRLVNDWNGDVEAAASTFPGIRLIRVPTKGSQELMNDFKGGWTMTTPETAKTFTAVGFLFGRYIHQIVHVPVGLIENDWGGAACEAFIRRSSLDGDPRFKTLMDATAKREAALLPDNGNAEYTNALVKWEADAAKAKLEKRNPPSPPQRYLEERNRPGNIFGAMVHPVLGYGIKGAIWYQGEQNSGRPKEYRELFPFLIEQWRKEWQQGDFPFYWVQLADFQPEKPAPGDSNWAELREAQTKTMRLPNTGQAVIIDLGEQKDIHPRNKHDVAARLVRWALANDYGIKIPFRSPEFNSMSVTSNRVVATFDCFGSKLRTFDVNEARGFAICGADKQWQFAPGKILDDNTVEIWNEKINAPVAVRYAWADNPVCNLYSNDGLPVTPFRTDGDE